MAGEYLLAAIILPIITAMLIYCIRGTRPKPEPRRMIVLTKHGDTWR
jgi:hypothetical protein